MDAFLRQFEINFVGLNPGIHHFKYHITNTFFEHFEGSLITEADIRVALKMEKENSFFQLEFLLSGTVDLPCNRCTKLLHFPVDADFPLVVKLDDRIAGEEVTGEDFLEEDDVWFIPRQEHSLNVAQLIYEYINLSTPEYKVICERMGKKCDAKMLQKINQYRIQPNDQPVADARWDSLKKIKIR